MTKQAGRFGTFEGVFTPTFLTIIGVIMYLRLGWVVGNAGLGGALLIIVLAKVVTISTGLALSSMTTNIKIGAGGVYALISRSLGAEIGSAIGIPLYVSLALSGAMYLIGFTEAWNSIFPLHDEKLVSTVTLLVLLLISYFGAELAMKVQSVIMGIIVLSLLSFFLGRGDATGEIIVWGDFPRAPFWVVFSIFFPAVTGIQAGAAMSGDLRNPHRNIPVGILSAIFVSMIVYCAVAIWFSYTSPTDLLLNNYTIMMDISRWRVLVLAGIMGATLSSALGTIVGGPRTLMALGQDKVLPFSRFFAWKTKKGDPRLSIIFTGFVIEISLLLGDLNSIAPLVTMIFLITYGAVNLVVLIEKGIKLPSFRPSFKIPTVIPLIGTLWCLVIMVLINAIFATVAIFLILVVYLVQVKRGITAPWGDVRSGLFSAIAEWAAQTSARMPHHAKVWKPNLLIPVENPENWDSFMSFIRDIVFPGGTLRAFSVNIITGKIGKIGASRERKSGKRERMPVKKDSFRMIKLESQLNTLVEPIKNEDIFTAAIAVESHNFIEGVDIISRVMKGMFFPPNIIFLTKSEDPSKVNVLKKIFAIAARDNLGIILLSLKTQVEFGEKQLINVWLRTGSPNIDLSLLIALQLERNWNADIKLLTVVEKEKEERKGRSFLRKIISAARMPSDTEIVVSSGDFKDAFMDGPAADLNIFGIGRKVDFNLIHEMSGISPISCIFVKDSGLESATV